MGDLVHYWIGISKLGDDAPDVDTADEVEEGAVFVGPLVETVGIPIQSGEEHLVAAFLVALLSGGAGGARELFQGDIGIGGVDDPKLT